MLRIGLDGGLVVAGSGQSGLAGVARGWRQRIGLTTRAGGVERAEFSREHAQRPAIAHDVVRGQQQQVMLARQFEQPKADEGAFEQVKRGLDLMGQARIDLPLLLGGGLIVAASLLAARQ